MKYETEAGERGGLGLPAGGGQGGSEHGVFREFVCQWQEEDEASVRGGTLLLFFFLSRRVEHPHRSHKKLKIWEEEEVPSGARWRSRGHGKGWDQEARARVSLQHGG